MERIGRTGIVRSFQRALVARIDSQDGLEAGGVEPPREHDGSGDVGQRDRLGNEQDAEPAPARRLVRSERSVIGEQSRGSATHSGTERLSRQATPPSDLVRHQRAARARAGDISRGTFGSVHLVPVPPSRVVPRFA